MKEPRDAYNYESALSVIVKLQKIVDGLENLPSSTRIKFSVNIAYYNDGGTADESGVTRIMWTNRVRTVKR